MRSTLTFLVILFAVNCFGQQYSQKYSDLQYVSDGQVYHKLDIYLPKVSKSKYPVVIYIYGSAFLSNNSKGTDMNTIGAALLDAGFAVVTPNHRSSSDALYPAQIQDIKAVVRFIRGASGTYKLDTSFVGISGSSSGGQLASLAGTTRNVKSFTRNGITMDLEGSLGNHTAQISSVDAVCDWFGPTDFLKMDSCGGSIFNNNAADSPASKLIGGEIQKNKDKSQMTNPITYVDPSDPPFLIIHGTTDNVVPYCESQFLDRALTRSGVSSQFITVPNGGHGGGVTISNANLNAMVQFFSNRLSVVTSTESGLEVDNNESVYFFSNENELVIRLLDYLQASEYELFDISGRKIASGPVNKSEYTFSLSGKGMYVFKAHMKNGNIITRKILVN